MIVFRLIQDDVSRTRLLLASNRDEFIDRPTSLLHVDVDGVIGGRDEKRGGTWLAFSARGGRFAMVTNVRAPGGELDASAPSRGALVTQFVGSPSLSCATFLQSLESTRTQYSSYNIVFGDLAAGGIAYWFTNHIAAAAAAAESSFASRHARLALGTTYGLSNEASIVSTWPKVRRAVAAFDAIVDDVATTSTTAFATSANRGAAYDYVNSPLSEADDERLFARLFAMLGDAERPSSVAQLPRTGVPLEVEMALASIFVERIEAQRYGTVSSCVAHIDALGPLRVVEHSHRAPRTPPTTFRAARHIRTDAVRAAWPADGAPSSASASSSLAPTGRLVVVGDVHACARELEQLVAAARVDGSRGDRLVLLGDLVRRRSRRLPTPQPPAMRRSAKVRLATTSSSTRGKTARSSRPSLATGACDGGERRASSIGGSGAGTLSRSKCGAARRRLPTGCLLLLVRRRLTARAAQQRQRQAGARRPRRRRHALPRHPALSGCAACLPLCAPWLIGLFSLSALFSRARHDGRARRCERASLFETNHTSATQAFEQRTATTATNCFSRNRCKCSDDGPLQRKGMTRCCCCLRGTPMPETV